MKKILITGAGGFVGGHFIRHISSLPQDYEIHAISRSQPSWDFFPGQEEPRFIFHKADLADASRVATIAASVRPDQVLHLAAQSSVGESWNSPVTSFVNNTTIFLNVIDAIRVAGCNTRILSVGSSEQYGVVTRTDLPLSEDHPQRPANPYAVARVAQEHLAGVYHDGFGMDICCTRSFNHCGPGQTDRFVASSIAKQFARIKLGMQAPVIDIGDGTIIRDFLDVRDVVAAYQLILENGISGQVYNVCSGRGYAIRELVMLLSDRLDIPVQLNQNPMKLRPQDNPAIFGSPGRIRSQLGWEPYYPISDSLEDMVEYWTARLKGG